MDKALRIICAKENKGFLEVSEAILLLKLYLAKKKSLAR